MTLMHTRFRFVALAVTLAGALLATARSQPLALGPATPGASPVASPAALPTGRSVSVANSVTIQVTDGGFDPAYVESTNGHDLTITLINRGQRLHAFRIDRLNVDVRLDLGQTKTVVIHAPGLGDYPFYSDAPGDEGLTGRLTFYI